MEVIPRHLAASSSTGQPVLPYLCGRTPESSQRTGVTSDAVVREVPLQFLTQLLVLRRRGLMSVSATPLRQRLEPTTKPALGRLALHHPVAVPGPRPVVRKPQKIKAPRRLPPLGVRSGRCTGGPLER